MNDTDSSLKFNIKTFCKSKIEEKFNGTNWTITGKVCDVIGTIIEANLAHSKMEMLTEIEYPGNPTPIFAQVVGFRGDRTLLLPFSTVSGIGPGAKIRSLNLYNHIPVGNFLLGKVIDPFMRMYDDPSYEISKHCKKVCLDKLPPNPLLRERIQHPLSLGIRSIDSMLTFGEGQRLGIMAGSGVGKSVLLGMIARGSSAEVNVIGLIGERGREVREFIEKDLGPEGLARSVIVAATSDQSPLLRLRAAKVTMAIAEYFSSQGKKVLLMMDSLTRVAQAQREVGLAVGEPSTTKGYPPSVFSLLPRLLERSGPQIKGDGSISALYTVLVDGDDFNDPIPDTVRSILDGHINLSRSLASKAHFPAIQITNSVSRIMQDIVPKHHYDLALQIKKLLSVYEENYDYIHLGTYTKGSNKILDLALELMPSIENFLCQSMNERSSYEESLHGMIQIFKQKRNA